MSSRRSRASTSTSSSSCTTDRATARRADGADASPYLFAADALITDHSSVGFEFMLLDRPVIVIDCPTLVEKARIGADKVRLLRSAAAVATGPASVAAAVTRAIVDPSALSATRRAIAADLFYCPGTATERAVRCVYETLGMPATAVTGDSRCESRATELDGSLSFEPRMTPHA
jgi:hypothetical protein